MVDQQESCSARKLNKDIRTAILHPAKNIFKPSFTAKIAKNFVDTEGPFMNASTFVTENYSGHLSIGSSVGLPWTPFPH